MQGWRVYAVLGSLLPVGPSRTLPVVRDGPLGFSGNLLAFPDSYKRRSKGLPLGMREMLLHRQGELPLDLGGDHHGTPVATQAHTDSGGMGSFSNALFLKFR
jgi:hypothetical protein